MEFSSLCRSSRWKACGYGSTPNSGSHYYNYKGTHSIILLSVVDACYRFLYVDVGCNGMVADSGVFSNCSLYKGLEDGSVKLPEPSPLPQRDTPVPCVFLTDDAFAMSSYILKPYPFRNQPAPNRIFNYRLSRARRVVESTFGIVAKKFQILRRPIRLCPNTVEDAVLAICATHNFILSTSDSRAPYLHSEFLDVESTENHSIHPGQRCQDDTCTGFLPLEQGTRHNCCDSQVRDEFREYFMSPSGEVNWQYQHI